MRIGPGGMFALSCALILVLIGLMYWGGGNGLGRGDGKTITIYCAQGVQKPMEKIIAEYEKLTDVTVLTNYSGSGTLLAMIDAANSGDIYLAADISYCEEAREKGVVDEIFSIAYQRPVLAVAIGNPKNILSVDDLLARRDELRISLADPERAAISRVAKSALDQEGKWLPLWESLLVSRGTVDEVATDVGMDNCDVGIVWNATALQRNDIDIVDDALFLPQEKTIALSVLSMAKNPTRALHFARFVTARDRGLLHFEEFGYDPVEGDTWAHEPEITIYSGGLNRLAVQETIHDFEKREGVTVLTNFSGCGVLVDQMEAGASPDMYFACDVSFMKLVEDKFLQSMTVSTTKMVVITSTESDLGTLSLRDLTREGLKVGITNPEKSALGALSRNLLQKHGLWEAIQESGNIKDMPATADTLVYQVEIGALDAAIVYQANTSQSDKLVVSSINDPTANAVQPIAIGRDSPHSRLAERLVRRIRSAQSRELFEDLGFQWVEATTAP